MAGRTQPSAQMARLSAIQSLLTKQRYRVYDLQACENWNAATRPEMKGRFARCLLRVRSACHASRKFLHDTSASRAISTLVRCGFCRLSWTSAAPARRCGLAEQGARAAVVPFRRPSSTRFSPTRFHRKDAASGQDLRWATRGDRLTKRPGTAFRRCSGQTLSTIEQTRCSPRPSPLAGKTVGPIRSMRPYAFLDVHRDTTHGPDDFLESCLPQDQETPSRSRRRRRTS